MEENDIVDVEAKESTVEEIKKENNQNNLNVRDYWFYNFVKRSFDIFFAVIMIILTGLPMLIVAISIKIFTPGKVFFRDKRIGRNGKIITIYKFRSMYSDAESNIDKYLSPEQKAKWLEERKLDNDPRITKIGRFTRKTSIDELPQLFNILSGDISVVGPRPITEYEMTKWFNLDEQKAIQKIKPGLTGYWQVKGRSDVLFENGERQKIELEYLSKRGIWMDFLIILKTPFAIFKGKGAK